MTQLLPAREVVTTACTLDCPDTCSLAVTVEIGAGGDRRIVDIDAAPGNPLTDGWICAKVKRHMRRVYAPERVTTPLIRVGAKGEGRFRIATWDEAIGTIADRMREAIGTAGSDSIVAFTYNDVRQVRCRDAGFVQVLLHGMSKQVITFEGRNLRELAELLTLGLIRWVRESDDRDGDLPESGPGVIAISIDPYIDE